MLAWTFRIFLLQWIAIVSTKLSFATPSQVIIVRHAERYPFTGDLAGQLDAKGLRRAGALASYLKLQDETSTNVQFLSTPPTVAFACRPNPVAEVTDGILNTNNTIRCIQTITPTAGCLGIPIHCGFALGQETELAQLILNHPKYNGQVVLICWHSSGISSLVSAFGYTFPYSPYPATRFDLVWSLVFPAPTPPAPAALILQELLYGDSSTPP